VDFKNFRTIVEKEHNNNKNKKKKVSSKIMSRLFRYSREEKWLALAMSATTLISIGL